jgi:hypothetical protein
VADVDTRVRLHIYEHFLEEGSPPTTSETAVALEISHQEAEVAYRSLEAHHAIVLAPGSTNVWMANPLSAVPTPFHVQTARGSYWGNCIWDGLGVVAMLGGAGRVDTACQDCQEPLTFTIEHGALEPTEAVAHFAVPAAQWWVNIGFT